MCKSLANPCRQLHTCSHSSSPRKRSPTAADDPILFVYFSSYFLSLQRLQTHTPHTQLLLRPLPHHAAALCSPPFSPGRNALSMALPSTLPLHLSRIVRTRPPPSANACPRRNSKRSRGQFVCVFALFILKCSLAYKIRRKCNAKRPIGFILVMRSHLTLSPSVKLTNGGADRSPHCHWRRPWA